MLERQCDLRASLNEERQSLVMRNVRQGLVIHLDNSITNEDVPENTTDVQSFICATYLACMQLLVTLGHKEP